MSLGQELQKARKRMHLTASEVAAATRMKVQIVEAIEADDFSVFAAAIYGKGFIRLFAEYVGLDSRALIEEFTETFSVSERPAPRSRMRALEPGEVPKSKDPATSPEPDLSDEPESEPLEPPPAKRRREPAKARPTGACSTPPDAWSSADALLQK